jgi:hypothetical protein
VEVAAQLKQDVKGSGTHANRIFPLIYSRCSSSIPFFLDILPPVESTTNMGYWNLVLLKFIVSYDANIHEIQEYAEAEHHYYEMKEVPIISPKWMGHQTPQWNIIVPITMMQLSCDTYMVSFLVLN